MKQFVWGAALWMLMAVSANAAIYVIQPDGTKTNKISLTAAATAADAVGRVVVVTSAYTVGADLTWPTDRVLKIEKSGLLTIASGKVLTINGPLRWSGVYRIFAGSGAVILGSGSVSEIPIELFGPDGVDDGVAMQKAIDANFDIPVIAQAGKIYYIKRQVFLGRMLRGGLGTTFQLQGVVGFLNLDSNSTRSRPFFQPKSSTGSPYAAQYPTQEMYIENIKFLMNRTDPAAAATPVLVENVTRGHLVRCPYDTTQATANARLPHNSYDIFANVQNFTIAESTIRTMSNPNGDMVWFSETTATGGSANTITCPAQSWIPDNYTRGFTVKILSGTGAGQSRIISANATAGGTTTFTVGANWTTPPDNTSHFEVQFGQGGLWIRAYGSAAVGTKVSGITIRDCEFHSNQVDEPVAVFTKDYTVDGVLIENCQFYTYDRRNRFIRASTSGSGTIKNVTYRKCYFETVGTSKVSIAIAGSPGSNINVVNCTMRLNFVYNGYETPYAVINVASVTDSEINILSADLDGQALGVLYGVSQVERVSNLRLTVAAGVYTAGATGIYLRTVDRCKNVTNSTIDGQVYGVERLTNSSVNGWLYNVSQASNCSMTVTTDFPPFRTESTTGKPYIYDNIIITDTFGTPASPYLMNLQDSSQYSFSNITYKGARTGFGFGYAAGTKILRFDNVTILDGSSNIVAASNRILTASNPWTVYGAGAQMLPVGHIVMMADGTSALHGWKKITGIGDQAAHWVPTGLQSATQAASVAADITALKADFNALLTKLKASGAMAP